MKNRNVILFVACGLNLLINCKNATDNTNISEGREINLSQTKECLSKNEREESIESILRTPEFQEFLHPELDGRLPVILLKSDFITSDLSIEVNGRNVVFEDSLETTDQIVRIQISDIACKTKEFRFSLYYPIESAVIQGVNIKKGMAWETSVTSSGEID